MVFVKNSVNDLRNKMLTFLFVITALNVQLRV